MNNDLNLCSQHKAIIIFQKTTDTFLIGLHNLGKHLIFLL